jgi:hypothetical protein
MVAKITTAKRPKKGDKMSKKQKPYVIVRSHTAGVHSGYLESRKGDTVILSESRRLWQWAGASLSQVANTGPANGTNKFGGAVLKTEIVSPQGFEIATCRKEAIKAIQSVPEWKV